MQSCRMKVVLLGQLHCSAMAIVASPVANGLREVVTASYGRVYLCMKEKSLLAGDYHQVYLEHRQT